MKQVQIPERLLLELIKFHLGEIPADEEYICRELQRKLDSMAARQRYSEQLGLEKRERNAPRD